MKLAARLRNLLLKTTLLFGAMVCAVGLSEVCFANVSVCPFCASVGLTFTDQMSAKDVVISAKLLEIPEPDEDDDELPRAKFEIVKVFRGKELVKEGMKFRALLVGRYPVGQKFFVMGVNPPDINWTTPMKATDRVLEYLGKLDKLPEKGADRLAFFQEYFEDEESLLAFDAYDEFAKAPYEDLIELKDRMDRKRIISLIQNDKTSPNRRRLYFTMLGVCGEEEDAKMLEELLVSGSRKKMRGLEALIACYLNLKGESGMDLIQKEFFENKDCEFTYTMLAMQALRFHAEETDLIPKDRIIAAARTVLDNDEARDLVIPDLARWEDWTVMEKLVSIFKTSGEDDNWIRVPIASYLMACPLPEAKTHLAELKELDAASIARAKFLSGMDFDEDEIDEDDGQESSDEEEAEVDVGYSPDPDSSLAPFEDTTEFVSLVEDPVVERHVVKKVEQPAVDSMENSDAANPIEQTFVSNKSASSQNSRSMAQVAPSNSPPIAAAPVVAIAPNLTWQIIFIPMGVSVVLFVLLWSVLSGWFERLIF
jgi:hypothetical protein